VKNAAELARLANVTRKKAHLRLRRPRHAMQLVGEIFKQQSGVDAVHVPYRSAAPTLQDLLAGQIDYYFDLASGFSHVRERRARQLAVMGTKRSSFFADAPRLAEASIQGMELDSWFELFAPAPCRRTWRRAWPAKSAMRWCCCR
jgi:tripartite-type tricarboxylate transporter receptor subunit TctC